MLKWHIPNKTFFTLQGENNIDSKSDYKSECERQPVDSPNTDQEKACGEVMGAEKPYNF